MPKKDLSNLDIPMKDVEPARGFILLEELPEPNGSSILTPDSAKDQAQFGRVIAVGMGYFEQGSFIEIDVKEGDMVYFAKWKGLETSRGIGKEKRKYKLVENKMIHGIIKSNK